MPMKRYKPEQIVALLRQIEVVKVLRSRNEALRLIPVQTPAARGIH